MLLLLLLLLNKSTNDQGNSVYSMGVELIFNKQGLSIDQIYNLTSLVEAQNSTLIALLPSGFDASITASLMHIQGKTLGLNLQQ